MYSTFRAIRNYVRLKTMLVSYPLDFYKYSTVHTECIISLNGINNFQFMIFLLSRLTEGNYSQATKGLFFTVLLEI